MFKRRISSADDFMARNGGIQQEAKVHAEVAVAHIFHTRDLHFARGVRYIGCSKASCFACSAYLTNHPGNFDERPCHGNAWFKWYPPRLSRDDYKTTSKILRKMVQDMQEDVKKPILGEDVGRRLMFESTTGISTDMRVLIFEALAAAESS